MPKWTEQQQAAITARDGTVLVSAAAGSGKTAVLVERVAQRVCADGTPCDINELLIVTFTRAAAAEMRERIGTVLAARSAENPGNRRLARQQILLEQAQIGTIDSFCSALVRENFHILGVPPDFRTLDDGESALLKSSAALAAVEELYGAKPPHLVQLRELMGNARSDTQLIESIQRIYSYIQAYPFPEEWIARADASYACEGRLAQSVWGGLALRQALETAHCAMRMLDACRADLRGADENLQKGFCPVIEYEYTQIAGVVKYLEDGEWDAAYRTVQQFAFPTLRASKVEDKQTQERVKARRNYVKYTLVQKRLKELLCANEQDCIQDLAALRPVLELLLRTVARFGELYHALKTEKNSYDFADIEHLALDLLVENTADGVVFTPFAQEVSKRYREILVDEYQDVNEAQELLFRAVSRGEKNLFFVGDVKQSIYRFRQAMPEIFLRRREAMPVYAPGCYPARIMLGCNFRSRPGVTDAVNFVFSRILSKQAGELAYTRDEELVCGAAYPEKETPDVYFDVLTGEMETPEYIARLIHEKVTSGMTVQDKSAQGEGRRPVRYGDFCILLRAFQGRAEDYARALKAQGIPVRAGGEGDLLAEPEVRVMLSLLRVIDNPMQDIPLTAAMLSPVFGFTPDDLARIRAACPAGDIYAAVCRAANSGDPKCRAMLASLAQMRDLSCALPAGELVSRIYDLTDYPTIAAAGKQGARENLDLFRFYAVQSERNGNVGGAGFVRYLDAVQSGGGTLDASAGGSGEDAVGITSIHKSKGLEYPVCILADCEKAFNTRSLSGNVVLHPKYGAGLKMCDVERLRKFDTIANRAAAAALRTSELSEQLRVLYVALTRAKEELMLVSKAAKLPEKAALAAAVSTPLAVEPAYVLNANSYFDWLLAAFIRHPDAQALRDLCPFEVTPSKAEGRLAVRLVEDDGAAQETQEEAVCEDVRHVSGGMERLVSGIRERVEYRYPYAALAEIAAKRAASQEEGGVVDQRFFATSRPAFLGDGGMTPAQRGTATHLFMQFADYEQARADARTEGERLAAQGFLSTAQAQAVEYSRVERFFQSELYGRMCSAQQLLRELKFAIEVPAQAYYDLPAEELAGETVFVQGIVDCVLIEPDGVVIVDYKTDHVQSPRVLRDKYRGQLAVYRRAMRECLGREVKECLLYSFHLGQTVPV